MCTSDAPRAFGYNASSMSNSKPKKPLGALLVELGRISEAEIERALEHQRLQGGYFGQALVDLGIIDQQELDLGLSTQANIPYVTPDPEQIDPEVASLMPAIWAQRHNAMPIERDKGWLTLVVDSPLKSGLADELARRTGLSVRLALCSPRVLNDAIRKVYHLDPVQDGASSILSLEAFWSLATSPPASSWGLSVRRNQVIGWIDSDERISRHVLMHNWLSFLDQLLSPPPSSVLPPHGLRQWRATVRSDQSPPAVMIESLSGPGGHDLVFEPVRFTKKTGEQLPSTEQLLSLRKQVNSQERTVIAVHSPTGRSARELVTKLPKLLLKPDHRSVCLLSEGAHAISDDVLVVPPQDDGEEDVLEFLERLNLDAVGLDIEPTRMDLWERMLELAPLVLVVMTGSDAPEPLPHGVDRLLTRPEESAHGWTLK